MHWRGCAPYAWQLRNQPTRHPDQESKPVGSFVFLPHPSIQTELYLDLLPLVGSTNVGVPSHLYALHLSHKFNTPTFRLLAYSTQLAVPTSHVPTKLLLP